MTSIDFTTGVGPQIRRQLDEEKVVWLTTVSSDGTPQPNPVWFAMDDDDIIIYSNRSAARNKNILRNSKVSLNFNSDPHAHHMSVITGTAVIDDSYPKAHESESYMAKYGHFMPGLDMTAEQYAETFGIVLRITPEKIRGF